MTDFLDLIMEGNFLTLSDAQPLVGAVGIKSGKIAMAGDYAEVEAKAGADTQHLSLKSQTVVPGFIETHMHPTQVGNVLLNLDEMVLKR